MLSTALQHGKWKYGNFPLFSLKREFKVKILNNKVGTIQIIKYINDPSLLGWDCGCVKFWNILCKKTAHGIVI